MIGEIVIIIQTHTCVWSNICNRIILMFAYGRYNYADICILHLMRFCKAMSPCHLSVTVNMNDIYTKTYNIKRSAKRTLVNRILLQMSIINRGELYGYKFE